MAKSSDIPFARDSSSFFISWISMLMVFIATLILATALITHDSVKNWHKDIAGSLTVQIPSYDSDGKKRGELLQSDTETALTIIRSADGVLGATVLSDAQMDSLMAPWLGEHITTTELPLPKLIDVTIDTKNLPDLNQIKADLSEQVPMAILDSHRIALSKLITLAQNIIRLVGIVLILILISLAFSIMFVTKSGLKVHRKVISLIHMMGASDFYITRQFANRSFYLTLIGGIIGFLIALPVMMFFAYYLNNLTGSFILNATLTHEQWGILTCIPVLTATLSYLTAFKTVWGDLKRSL
ncbi:MAG: hypothetical protein IKZ02_03780 [Alphaproteobacteria bacterium]|nr:hypothetical protein [Alphaproteobacteria bacterium]